MFEATRYFSDITDVEPKSHRPMLAERKNVDLPNLDHAKDPQHRIEVIIKPTKNKIKTKRPSSPGAKLGIFLNTFFQQHYSTSKKKASKLVKSDQEEHAGRKRSTSNFESKSCWYYSPCSAGEFRAPSVHYKEREEFKDRVEVRWEELNLKKVEIEKVEDGTESDSSSDLFELKNYGLGTEFPSELPVYGSVDIDVIRRGIGRICHYHSP